MNQEEEFKSELILQAAKKLFYDKGYNETKLSDIASVVGIHKTLVSYYYQKKQNLANQVMHDYIINYTLLINQVLLKELGEVDPIYSSALRSFVIFHGFAENKGLCRFYLDLRKEFSLPIYGGAKRIPIEKIKEKFSIDYDEKRLKLIQFTDNALRDALITAFFNGLTDLSLDEAIEYKVKLLLQMFSLPEDFIDEVYIKSKEIYEKADFIYGPGFNVNCRLF